MSEVESLLNSPEMKALMKDAEKHPEKYGAEVRVKEVAIEKVK